MNLIIMFGQCKPEIFMVLYSGHSIEKTANRASGLSRYRGTPRTFFAYATLQLKVLMRISYVRNRKILWFNDTSFLGHIANFYPYPASNRKILKLFRRLSVGEKPVNLGKMPKAGHCTTTKFAVVGD